MILELILRHYFDPNPRETALAQARLQLARNALIEVAQIVREAAAGRAASPPAAPAPSQGPAPTWTREQPTLRLRFHNGALQQMWVVNEMNGTVPGAKRDEWRDVPTADDGVKEKPDVR